VRWSRDVQSIHDSAVDADELIFGAPAEDGEFFAVDFKVGGGADCHRGGDLERGRGAEAGADGDISLDGGPHAAEGIAFFQEDVGDAHEVVRPGPVGDLADMVEAEGVFLAEVEADQFDGAVVRWTAGDPYVSVDGHGKDESAVVVGVVANEVHPAGCADEEERPGAELLDELSDWHGPHPAGEMTRKRAGLFYARARSASTRRSD